MHFFFVGIKASNLEVACLYYERFATACPELDSGKRPAKKKYTFGKFIRF